MALNPRLLAAQGFVFPLSAIALAVQGFLVSEPAIPVLPQFRPAVIGRSPGTTINYSDFIARHKRANLLPAQAAPHSKIAKRKQAIKRRQRMEEEVLYLQSF